MLAPLPAELLERASARPQHGGVVGALCGHAERLCLCLLLCPQSS